MAWSPVEGWDFYEVLGALFLPWIFGDAWQAPRRGPENVTKILVFGHVAFFSFCLFSFGFFFPPAFPYAGSAVNRTAWLSLPPIFIVRICPPFFPPLGCLPVNNVNFFFFQKHLANAMMLVCTFL